MADYNVMKKLAKDLGVKGYIGKKADKLMDMILDNIEARMDEDGWPEENPEAMEFYEANTAPAEDEEEGEYEEEEEEEIDLDEEEEKVMKAKEKAKEKKAEKKKEKAAAKKSNEVRKATKRDFVQSFLKKFHSLEEVQEAFSSEFPNAGNSIGNIKSHINNLKKIGMNVECKDNKYRVTEGGK